MHCISTQLCEYTKNHEIIHFKEGKMQSMYIKSQWSIPLCVSKVEKGSKTIKEQRLTTLLT